MRKETPSANRAKTCNEKLRPYQKLRGVVVDKEKDGDSGGVTAVVVSFGAGGGGVTDEDKGGLVSGLM